MSRFQKYFVLLAMTALLIMSCARNTACDESLNSSVNLQFYRITDGEEETASFDNITAYGLNSNSLIYDLKDSLSSVFLPLNQLQDNCIFVLSIESIVDTLWFDYTRKLDFISENCGYAMRFSITSMEATHHLIDSISIINPVVNNNESENIKVFY
jgi:hypothetical protein